MIPAPTHLVSPVGLGYGICRVHLGGGIRPPTPQQVPWI